MGYIVYQEPQSSRLLVRSHSRFNIIAAEQFGRRAFQVQTIT